MSTALAVARRSVCTTAVVLGIKTYCGIPRCLAAHLSAAQGALAIAFMLASILLGLAGGAIAGFAESRGWLTPASSLKNAAEFLPQANQNQGIV
jgi:hypothetical protein